MMYLARVTKNNWWLLYDDKTKLRTQYESSIVKVLQSPLDWELLEPMYSAYDTILEAEHIDLEYVEQHYPELLI